MKAGGFSSTFVPFELFLTIIGQFLNQNFLQYWAKIYKISYETIFHGIPSPTLTTKRTWKNWSAWITHWLAWKALRLAGHMGAPLSSTAKRTEPTRDPKKQRQPPTMAKIGQNCPELSDCHNLSKMSKNCLFLKDCVLVSFILLWMTKEPPCFLPI